MDKKDETGIHKILDGVPDEKVDATAELMRSLAGHRSRRQLLRSTMGLAVAGATSGALTMTEALHVSAVHAEMTHGGSVITQFFSILATGEELFSTFYRLGIANHDKLGIRGSQLIALEAILAEEEIHTRFAKANGGVPATNTFSFPHGAATFTNRQLFLETQQLAEELTNGALLAWIKDTASMNMPRLAQIGGQLMQVEGGHRVVGRVIAQSDPWDNWGFGPVTLNHFLDVPAAVKAAGFLSPVPGNSFTYKPTRPSFPGVINTHS